LNTEYAENTELVIYNLKGQKVKQLIKDQLSAGQHTAVWNGLDDEGKSVTSGVYFYKLKAGNFEQTKKMILMK
jgi:flagellar hook assembly protein FlgD